MKAYVCEAFGPLDTHGPGELPRPEPKTGEVRIRVVDAGVNFYDTLIVQGKYQVKPAVSSMRWGLASPILRPVTGSWPSPVTVALPNTWWRRTR